MCVEKRWYSDECWRNELRAKIHAYIEEDRSKTRSSLVIQGILGHVQASIFWSIYVPGCDCLCRWTDWIILCRGKSETSDTNVTRLSQWNSTIDSVIPMKPVARIIVPIVSVLQISRIVENRAKKALRSVSKKHGGGTEQSLATGYGTGSIRIHGFHPAVWWLSWGE